MIQYESVFDTTFFLKFTPPNSKKLQSLVDKITKAENDDPHAWDGNCLVETIALNADNWIEHLGPSLDMVSSHFDYTGAYQVGNPWVNLYNENGFQEVHDHHECDMSAVFFVNHGNDFAKFYFYDRMSGMMSRSLQKLTGYKTCCYPDIQPGEFIIFPSSFLHGVSPHRSKEIRKTLAFNFSFYNK